ncbi:MAG: serine hydrolase [Actinomycetia bacterium]|nr:serine hydrolase [Actinomycetes bacterium]
MAALVDDVRAQYPFPGIALGICTRDGRGEMVYRGIAGDGAVVNASTVFRIGSVTKTMTALALLRQIEAGRISLDDPVNDHLPDLVLEARPGWRPATIRHLLTHTAGIGELSAWRDLATPMFGLAVPVGADPRPASLLYRGRLRLDVEPGTKWAYANHGFNVAGYLLETLTGEPLAQHLRSQIFEPLGMTHTDARRTERVTPGLATGYSTGRRGLRESRNIDVAGPGGGAVFSTLADLVTYGGALLDNGRGIVAPASLQLAFDVHYRPSPTHPGIGLSFFRDEFAGHRLVGHGGGMPGFTTAFVLAPDDGVGVVAVTNTGRPGVWIAAHRALCSLLGVDAGIPRRPLHPEQWAGLLGRYRPGRGTLTNVRTLVVAGGATVRATKRELRLHPALPLGPWRAGVVTQPVDDAGTRYALDGSAFGLPPVTLHVERDAGGRGRALHLGGLQFGALPALHRSRT